MLSVLDSLKDVAGVAGSFAMDTDGEVFINAMPSYVQSEELGKIAPRVSWIAEAAAELQVQNEWCTLFFSSYHLQVAPFAGGRLVMLTEPGVNARALRMAAKILCRKLERMAEGIASSRNSAAPPPLVDPAPRSVQTFEVHAQGRLSDRVAEPADSHRADLRQTQPSLPPASPASVGPSGLRTPSVVKTTGPQSQSLEHASPEARSSRRGGAPRSMIYRGRRYDVSG